MKNLIHSSNRTGLDTPVVSVAIPKAGISAVLAAPGGRFRTVQVVSRLPLSIHFDGASGRRLSLLVDPPFGKGPRGLVP